MSHDQMGRAGGALTRGAALVAAAKGDLDALDRRLQGQVSGVAGGWLGAGGSAFQALHARWSERQRQIVGALDELEASLRATEHDFSTTDDAASALHAALRGRIG